MMNLLLFVVGGLVGLCLDMYIQLRRVRRDRQRYE
jgi:hypothetical protein